MTAPICFKCMWRRPHPFHDDGKPNDRDAPQFYPGGKHGRPLYDGEKKKT
jgi:hypothetical protein